MLALIGAVLATRRGRKLVRSHVVPPLRSSISSVVSLGRSPTRLLVLFGGSVGVTLAYTVALTFAVQAFDGGVSFAQVGAVYLGGVVDRRRRTDPGGLGAIEAALVAGLTGVGDGTSDRRRSRAAATDSSPSGCPSFPDGCASGSSTAVTTSDPGAIA